MKTWMDDKVQCAQMFPTTRLKRVGLNRGTRTGFEDSENADERSNEKSLIRKDLQTKEHDHSGLHRALRDCPFQREDLAPAFGLWGLKWR